MPDKTTMREPTVKVRELVQEFSLGKAVVKALRGVDLDIYSGEFVSIMGPSGSGKSTLLNLIGGLDRFVSGSIIVGGMDIASLDENALAEYRRRYIGFVFQSFNLVSTMTALQNVELPLIFAGVERRRRLTCAKEALEEVGLGERLEHRPTELSGGEQQRVALARSLINSPSIFLADEPTGNLDTATSKQIMGLLKKLNKEKGQTLIMVTHDPEVSRPADRIVKIRDGKIVDGKGD